MLTALLNGEKVISTDERYEECKEEFRRICNANAVCPICRESIICKFGPIMIHHFAHRHNSDCPGNHETIEHMLGKKLLYDFLHDRYGDKGKVELEYQHTAAMITDVFICLGEGANWAVDFYCGGVSQKQVEEKIEFYKENNIVSNWLISSNRFNQQNDYLKIKSTDNLFIHNTGIDKCYIGDWYQKIVKLRMKRSLPKDYESIGSLMYLDVENEQLNIIRAISSGKRCNTLHTYRRMVSGKLDDVIITPPKKWGIVWYFEKEKALGNRYRKAEKILEELNQEYEKDKRMREQEQRAREEKLRIREQEEQKRRAANQKRHSEVGTSKPNEYNHDYHRADSSSSSGWGENLPNPLAGEFKCKICGRIFTFKDMSSVKLDERLGKCRECSRNGY